MSNKISMSKNTLNITVVSEAELKEASFKGQQRMEWAIGFMTVRYHFVYQILGMMNKSTTTSVPTMGVCVESGGQFRLVYNPLFVNALSDVGLTYVLYHEILHLVLHHCTHRAFDDRELGNIATDLAVNELVPVVKGSCEIPQGDFRGVHVSDLKKMTIYSDIKEKQTAEWYYEYLKKKSKENGSKGGKGKGKPEKGEGGEGGSSEMDNHDGWREDEVAAEKVRAKINEIAKNDSWGSIGGTEKEIILAAQVRRINWRNLLRQFYGNQAWHEKEGTRKRPNRRLGYLHPGSRKIQVDRHLVAIDTSGSVYSQLLSQFLATINQMTDYVPIDIMQFDSEITEEPRPFKRRGEYTFKGRGGTCFQPVIDLATKRRYKSLVIFTDGQAAEPTQPRAKVVWVLPEGCNPPVDWGMKIHMSLKQ